MVGDTSQKPVVLKVPGMDDVLVRRAVVYRHVGDVDLLMDVYLSTGLPTAFRVPIFMLIHGGPISSDL